MRYLVDIKSKIVAVLVIPAPTIRVETTDEDSLRFLDDPAFEIARWLAIRALDPAHGFHPFGAFHPAAKACLAHSGQGFADR